MRLRYYSFLSSFTLASVSYGALFQSFDEVPSKELYDFIIAGGGTAGCVIASRLSENPNFRVLLLEAGPSNQGVLELQVPGLAMSLWHNGTPFDWNYTTVPQPGFNGRSVPYVKGHVLGGGSSVNGMGHTRGSADDYDRWASVTGDEGWSWKRILPYILKNERFVSNKETHHGQFNSAFHNYTGVNYVTLGSELPRPLDIIFIQASQELKDDFPFNLDMNDGYPLGLGWSQHTIGNGTRSSSATSYLGSQYISRPNLDVVVNTRVTRVLKSNDCETVGLRTVEFVSGANQTLRTLTSQKEVILSLGSIGTPHILLNSGIGDEKELKKVGVKPIMHLPSVGKNMSDHVFTSDFSLSWSINMSATPINATEALNRWLDFRTGPYTYSSGNHLAWGRVRNVSSAFDTVQDSSSGPCSPHYELILVGTPQAGLTDESMLTIYMAVSSPKSRGYVSLNTNNPLDAPLIDPGYLSDKSDLNIAKEAIVGAKRFVEAPVFKDIILQPQGAYLNAKDDQELEQLIRDRGSAGFHAVGTASMSPRGAKYGVVDPDLLLKHARGLRVVDASVMPFIPAAHPQAAVYGVAERAADLIKNTWLETV